MTAQLEKPDKHKGKSPPSENGRQLLFSATTMSRWVPALALLVIIVLAWQLVSSFGVIPPYLLSSPLAIAEEMIVNWDTYVSASLPTLIAIVVGFLISILISLPLAIAMVYSPLLRSAIYPLVILSQVIPKVAIAPLFIIWFGFGQSPKILMVVLIAFFPLLIDAVVGFSAARPQSLMLVRSMGATRWQAFWKVRFPWALPSIFAGAKVAITLAVVGAVVAEFVGANSGLGVLITRARGDLDTVMVFAGIGYLSIWGLIAFGLIVLAEHLLVKNPHKDGFEAAGKL